MTADELDRAYVLLSQTITRVPAEEQQLFLSRLVLLLLAGAADADSAIGAIREAEGAGSPHRPNGTTPRP